jgi:hypothetical protein
MYHEHQIIMDRSFRHRRHKKNELKYWNVIQLSKYSKNESEQTHPASDNNFLDAYMSTHPAEIGSVTIFLEPNRTDLVFQKVQTDPIPNTQYLQTLCSRFGTEPTDFHRLF